MRYPPKSSDRNTVKVNHTRMVDLFFSQNQTSKTQFFKFFADLKSLESLHSPKLKYVKNKRSTFFLWFTFMRHVYIGKFAI